MDCLTCRDLKARYDVCIIDYAEARSSEYYRITHQFAAGKNVDMERARFELEEHRSVCVSARGTDCALAKKNVAFPERWLAA